ncbi:uncharacterized protein LOC121734262 isoform X2 [Aricia agestis]|uniref:uncharacterized protein LOC121734262 isoform X2 n=1 Tax=Aricia agestis TaxID=91739 RepID=UPI001C208B3C|nr:uncharacterized protein LOC121734262 isoform X2 [Aricia agestis]
MLHIALLSLWILHFHNARAQGDCTDLRGRVISHGLHYVPGPDTCTLCVCDNGLPKVCKSVLCSPPQDCQSFRMGDICCEFICLDDIVKPVDSTEANIRVAAGGAAAVFLLSLALIVYRIRRQKRRRPLHAEDQRSLTSIGYISGSMGYMGGTCETALGAWKPSGNYLPRGEAPPPYDEVVAQCRGDQIRINGDGSYHRSFASVVEPLQRAEDIQCGNHGYSQRSVAQIANTQNCYNAPLLQPVHQPETREATIITHHPLTANVPLAARLTGSLGAISVREPRPHNVPGFYAPAPTQLLTLHRTIPRISTDSGVEWTVAGEARRSFHRPRAAGRSVPRNLDIASAAPAPPAPHDGVVRAGSGRSRAHSAEEGDRPPPPPPPLTPPPNASLPLTVDKPSCVCSYSGGGGGADGGEDDYRSECENCKTTDTGYECGRRTASGLRARRHYSGVRPRPQRRHPPPPLCHSPSPGVL